MNGSTVQLAKLGQSSITASNAVVVSSSQITCTINLTGLATGYWDVIVSTGAGGAVSATLTNGFMVNSAPVVVPSTGIIAGKVTQTDGITSIQGAIIQALQSGTTTAVQAISNNSGNYSMQVVTGTYNVTASSTGYITQMQSGQIIATGQTTTVNFALAAQPANTGTILGQITKSDGITALTGAIVLALQSGTTTVQAISNNSGNYSMQVATGVYSVTVSSTGYVTQTKSGQAVAFGQTTTVNFALANNVVAAISPPTLSWEAGFVNGSKQSSGTVTTSINFGIHYADPGVRSQNWLSQTAYIQFKQR